MNILMTRRLFEQDIDYIKKGIKKRTDKPFQLIELTEYTEENILSRCEEADVLLGPFVTETIVEKANRLKFIQIPWTGLDTFNFKAVQKFSGIICNSHSNSNSVSEFGVALLLNLIKKISFHDQLMRTGDWNRDEKAMTLKSMSLSNAKIGIMGYGAIGRKMGKILKGFGSEIYVLANKDVQFPEITEIFAFSRLKEFCNQVDIIICSLPLTEETRGVFGTDVFNEIENKPYIVNVSRAEIFEPRALYDALSNDSISGYASDVWWNPNQELDFERFSNVVFSPHRAGYVEGALPHLDDVITNLANFITGGEVLNIVNITNQY
ncbi:NAD(P)-dependent oxidoreductase [Enterococcus sp. CWB-B31]|uniref:NAD(P)-dependent oxidoreductase n=1 Tax=Enterococcus sp. CWB-B31 TaxID=2885159 RepID=UPI001E44E71F|nr:NAD(P)-dependent oxidoreductase [Enterococcus sp. CWB-B31]MCB5954634.1 NAD(P)-binding domain-containing protein [Enterococcus sp. CWB-B31]